MIKKKTATKEFKHILPEALKEYGYDDDTIRQEIWELYLDHLYMSERIGSIQRRNWNDLPEMFKNNEMKVSIH